MTEYLEVRTPDGEIVLFESLEDLDGVVPAGRHRGPGGHRDGGSLRQGLRVIRAVAGAVSENLDTLAAPPNRISVEMGVKAVGEVGFAITKSTAEAHLVVTLEWTSARRRPSAAGEPGEAPPAGAEAAPSP